MRIDPLDDLAIKLEHEAEHTVSCGMLGTEIDGELAVVAFPFSGIGFGRMGFCFRHQASTFA
jgi:hypothetical protein